MKNIPFLEQHHQQTRGRSFGSDRRNVFLRGMAVHWLNDRCNPYWGQGDTLTPWMMLQMEPEPRPVIPTEQMPVDSQIRK